MSHTWLAVALALASALTQAFGTVMRHRTADGGGAGSGGVRGVFSALAQPYWWAGTGISLLGFVFQGLGLKFGSLLLVQPVTVLSLMFALPLGARFTGRRVSVAEWAWGSVLTICVGVIVVLGRPVGGDIHPPWWQWVIACVIGIVAVAALIVVARGRMRSDRAMLLGVAGGLAFAYVALFTKGVVERFGHGGFEELLRTGELYGLVVAAVLALTVQQASFNAGAVHQAIPASTVTTPVASIALGLGLLHERFSVAPPVLLVLAGAVVVMGISTVRLSHAEVHD